MAERRMMMALNPQSIGVARALAEGNNVDRQSRIEELKKRLDKVKGQIAEEEELERRVALVQSAFAKLKREMGKTLTSEEYQAIDGAYIFLHSGSVDLVRHVPSATDKGESKELEKILDAGDALQELKTLGETAG